MSKSMPPSEAEIRDQAYFFWEQDGRPGGRETEYWMRATVALSEKADADTLTSPPPPKPKSASADVKMGPRLKSAASKAVKKASPAAPKTPPKLKSAATKAKRVPAKPDGKTA